MNYQTHKCDLIILSCDLSREVHCNTILTTLDIKYRRSGCRQKKKKSWFLVHLHASKQTLAGEKVENLSSLSRNFPDRSRLLHMRVGMNIKYWAVFLRPSGMLIHRVDIWLKIWRLFTLRSTNLLCRREHCLIWLANTHNSIEMSCES